MAKLTTEDTKISNRYETILLAAHRARSLEFGAQSSIDVKNRKVKYALLALMEIEAGEIDIEELRKKVTNQGESTIKTTEVVKDYRQRQDQDFNYEQELKTRSFTEVSQDSKVKQMVYIDEEIDD